MSLATIRDHCLLLVKKKETWILPGGKPKENECDYDCLVREINEELGDNITLLHLIHYGDFVGVTPHKGDRLKNVVMMGEIRGDINPRAEISTAQWCIYTEACLLNLSDITKKIVKRLHQENYF